MLAKNLMTAMAGGSETLYVDDVFSSWIHATTGTTATISNGVDLTKGGLVWTKCRTAAGSHYLIDTARGGDKYLVSNNTDLQNTLSPAMTFNSSGYVDPGFFTSGQSQVSWTFRRAPKFFDVVTYTGDGTANRTVPHSLGIAPGMVVLKATNATGGWSVVSQITGGNCARLLLDSTAAASSFVAPSDVFSASTFNVSNIGSAWPTNTNGTTYVAYLFAHDPSAEGIIQCGSYTGTGAAGNPINLGWEPQYVLIKNVSQGTTNWNCFDSMRGLVYGANDPSLRPNTTESEVSISAIRPTASGFEHEWSFIETNASGSTYIYLAIRRPNKPPTTGTQVYNAIARTGTGAAATVTGVGFAPDAVITKVRSGMNIGASMFPRLIGSRTLTTSDTTSETSYADTITSWNNDGVSLGADSSGSLNSNGYPFITNFFRRAPGVFDVVAYTGTGSARTVNHSLGVAPELMIVKGRSVSGSWPMFVSHLGIDNYLKLESTSAITTGGGDPLWGNTLPTESVFTVKNAIWTNQTSSTYIAYLFATKAGISKVGSYTGNGSSQTIDCGFSAGARFILIKRTDSTGDWYVWDSVRGIVAANDPHLSLNSSAAEVTTNDSIDPANAGFIVNQVAATNINVNAATYIYLAFA